MKKILSLISCLFIAAVIFYAPHEASAGISVDQSCENTNLMSYETVGTGATLLQQVFRPTQNRLTQVTLKVGGNVSSQNVTLQILPYDSETAIAEKAVQPTISGPGYKSWVFNSEVTLTPDARYKIRLLKPMTGTLYWYTNTDPNCNSRGGAMRGSNSFAWDFDFITMGYTYTPPAEPETPSIPATPPNPETPSSNTTTASTTPSTTSAATQTKVVKTAAEAAKPVDESIKAPALTSIVKKGKTLAAPIANEVVLSRYEKVTLNGTSFPGAKVVVFAKDKAFDATTAADGTWTLLLDASDLTDGQYSITAQAQKDTKGSEKPELFKAKVLSIKSAGILVKGSTWNVFYTLVAVGILLLVLLLLLLIAKRHNSALAPIKTKEEKPEKKK